MSTISLYIAKYSDTYIKFIHSFIQAGIRRLYIGNIKLESNTAINASPRPAQFDFVVKCCSVKAY